MDCKGDENNDYVDDIYDDNYEPDGEDTDDDLSCDPVDQDELEELSADNNANANENEPNPTIDEHPNDHEQPQPEVETVDDTDDESYDDGFNDEPRRSTRVPQPVEHLTYSKLGETHSQIDTDKHVQFYDDDHRILELCHNQIAQVSPNPNDDM